jgi:hypothetical protein
MNTSKLLEILADNGWECKQNSQPQVQNCIASWRLHRGGFFATLVLVETTFDREDLQEECPKNVYDLITIDGEVEGMDDAYVLWTLGCNEAPKEALQEALQEAPEALGYKGEIEINVYYIESSKLGYSARKKISSDKYEVMSETFWTEKGVLVHLTKVCYDDTYQWQ